MPSRDLVIVRNGGPGFTDPTQPTSGASTVESPDFKELVRRITASVNDMPANTDPGPYSYPDDPSQFGANSYSNAIQPAPLIALLFGIGSGSMPNCTFLWCNGRSPLTDLGQFSADTVTQVTNALLATLTDGGNTTNLPEPARGGLLGAGIALLCALSRLRRRGVLQPSTRSVPRNAGTSGRLT